MTKEKYLRQRILQKNIEITTLTQQLDSLTSTCVELKDRSNDLQDIIQKLTDTLKDLKMDMARNELDKSLWER
tara:strand:+ start:309 stop:527 length:219 start_codon:yes stop_codon:yes gene_type:complete